MDLLFLIIIFAAIMIIMHFKRPFYEAVAGGLLLSVILYRIPPAEIISRTAALVTNKTNLYLILAMYFVMYLQQEMARRGLINKSVDDLNGVISNRRINTALAPTMVGMLPSSTSAFICADIIKRQTEGYLDPDTKAALTSWFKHAPESFLPTYSNTILFAGLAGISISSVTLASLPMFFLQLGIVYALYLRKIPKEPISRSERGKGESLRSLLFHMLPIIGTVFIILAFDLHVAFATPIMIVVCALVYRFKPADMLVMAKDAFQIKQLANTVLVLLLKEFIDYSGILGKIPDMVTKLPIPAFLAFGLIYLVGGFTGFSTGIIALVTPVAFAAVPGAGLPLMLLYMAMQHAASLLSPIHICLVFAAEGCNSNMGGLLRKTVIPCIAYIAGGFIWYYVLGAII